MHFYVKRYRYAVERRLHWMLLAVIPVSVYLVVSAIHPDRFTVRQDTPISNEAPISVMESPIDFLKMSEIISHYEDFFLDEFALTGLSKNLETIMPYPKDEGQTSSLRMAVATVMSMKTSDEKTVQIVYYGPDPKFGEILVNSYSQRLLDRVADGLLRSSKANAGHSRAQGAMPPSVDATAISRSMAGATENKAGSPMLGARTVEEHRAAWRPERLGPSLLIFSSSVAFMLLLLGILEWTDPSFKSERQVARYLGLPILGALPDLGKLSVSFKAIKPHSLDAT